MDASISPVNFSSPTTSNISFPVSSQQSRDSHGDTGLDLLPLVVSLRSSRSSLLHRASSTKRPLPSCWGGDARVQKFYSKHGRSQLSSAWVDSFGRELERDFSYISVEVCYQDAGYELCRGGTKGLEIPWVDYVYAVEQCCKLNMTVMPNMDVMHKIDYL
ncbi:ty3-gypsy retrotransposon protein [Cucumis melo var. makuwa]|uniref:Ty3-gypsy retrotransposon protein n=1 Tax=Cucumis melo var. makuwa TaxID=1194695 RepID=A0A5A7TAB4_CUCMM|nr:ty3-gypsy retrotransposon protein [Cucumis melo var. makuwa]